MPEIFGSSQVAASDWDETTGDMVVTFHKGARYAYSGVPADVAEGIHHTPSAGSYLNQNVKPFYAFRKL